MRQAAARLLATLSEPPKATTPNQRIVAGLARPTDAIAHGIALLDERAIEHRLAGIRLIQLALGDIGASSAKGTYGEGYTLRLAAPRKSVPLHGYFPTGHQALDREISRTLALLRDDSSDALKKVLDQITATSALADDFHYLAVLAQLPAARDVAMTRGIAAALLNLDRKALAGKIVRDRHWSLRLAEIHADLAKHDPKLNGVLLAHPDFGRPEHALFAQAPGFPRLPAAEILLARARKEPGFAWNAELVELIGELPASQSLAVFRQLWGEAGLEESILPILARHADAADRDKFLFGLRSPQPAALRVCLDALEKLPPRADADVILSLVRVIRRLSDTKEEKLLKDRVGKLLTRLTGQGHGGDAKAWSDWLTKAHPELSAKLGGADGVDVNAWKNRLAGIDWSAGDAARGQVAFIKASCAACHSGNQALGPDLRGVTGRFSRDDLLTAIIQPSRDVPSRYRTVAVETADGKVFQGLVVYEAPDSLILQTGPATTIRLVDTQIVGRGYSDISLMPAGTLDKVTDRDIADLLAYLRGLQ
jgi:putative heme-binding domain-containing protein